MNDISLPHISYSRIKTYDICPRQEYFRYRLNIVKSSPYYTQLGELIHLLLEYISVLDESILPIADENSLSDNIIYFDVENSSFYDTKKASCIALDISKYDNLDVKKSINDLNSKFVEIKERKDSKVKSEVKEGGTIMYEYYMSHQYDKFTFVGVSDLISIDEVENRAVIIDYKSGNSPKSVDYTQLKYYALLLSKQYPLIDSFKLIFIYKDVIKEKSITKDDLESVEKKLILKGNRIVSTYNTEPCNNKMCDYCPFADECTSFKKLENTIIKDNKKNPSISGSILSESVVVYNSDIHQKSDILGAMLIDIKNLNNDIVDEYISIMPNIKNIYFLDSDTKKRYLGLEYKTGHSAVYDNITIIDI